MKHYEYEISLYVEDELPLNKSEELLSHLSKCKKCKLTLHEYANIKNNIIQFYEKLPEKKVAINHTYLKKRGFNWNIRKGGFVVATSIAIITVLVYLFLSIPNSNQIKTTHVSSVIKEGAKKKNNNSENYFSADIKEKQDSIENNIKEFNKVIDKAIASKKQKSLSTELWNVGKDHNQEEFNKVINSILYNNNYYYD